MKAKSSSKVENRRRVSVVKESLVASPKSKLTRLSVSVLSSLRLLRSAANRLRLVERRARQPASFLRARENAVTSIFENERGKTRVFVLFRAWRVKKRSYPKKAGGPFKLWTLPGEKTGRKTSTPKQLLETTKGTHTRERERETCRRATGGTGERGNGDGVNHNVLEGIARGSHCPRRAP